MPQRWRKLGRILHVQGQARWMHSHAAVPIAEHIEGDLYRIYFSARDASNRSHTGYAVLDMSRPTLQVDLSTAPVLAPGSLGAFDDSGAMASWICCTGTTTWMYYIGWNLGVTVPFRNSIGVALRHQGQDSFEKLGDGPIVDRTLTEPHFTASCCVYPAKGAEPWRMWYLSCTGWPLIGDRPQHHYHIKYAESDDGVHWRRNGRVAIDFKDAGEYAISRPSVLRDGDLWRMWYSHRGAAYRIGYAESANGIDWTRLDEECDIDVTAGAWDSEMIEYPHVFRHAGQLFMLYNGNDYGRTGIGLAVLEP